MCRCRAQKSPENSYQLASYLISLFSTRACPQYVHYFGFLRLEICAEHIKLNLVPGL